MDEEAKRAARQFVDMAALRAETEALVVLVAKIAAQVGVTEIEGLSVVDHYLDLRKKFLEQRLAEIESNHRQAK